MLGISFVVDAWIASSNAAPSRFAQEVLFDSIGRSEFCFAKEIVEEFPLLHQRYIHLVDAINLTSIAKPYSLHLR
jgi:hypothetical protein